MRARVDLLTIVTDHPLSGATGIPHAFFSGAGELPGK
jgi:hypothetical protein